METGRQARAERLNERLRGAQRTNIGDESFNLDIGGLDAAPPPSSSPAKKRKLDSGSSAPVQNPPRTAPRRSPRTRNPYDLPDTSKDSAAQGDDATSNVRPGLQENGRNRASGSAMRSSQPGSGPKSGPLPAQSEPQPDALESLPPPSGAQSIEESPAHAPGSDRRRSLRPGSAVDKRARNLQGGLDHTYSEGSVPMTSSPLVQKTRRSEAAAIVRSVRSIRQTMSRSPGGDEDELSPDRPRRAEVPDSEDIGASAVGDEVGQDELGDDEQAQEIGDAEGLRRSPRGLSPQLGSNDREEASSPKRTRRRPAKSPATRKQRAPKAKSKPQKQPARSKPREQPKKGRPKAPPNRRRNSDDGTAAIELTVQRFVNHKRRGGEDGDDADPLQLDIPFANRTAESAVDVFAQVCDEVIGNTLEQFQEMSNNATEAAKRKEFRVKIRAVEAYREVLNSRLLQHTIHLNHWHSLRKRLRNAQKEKLELREEIIRLKAEREQVALRMDAVRIKHEADTKESTYLLNTSSTMRDIDLAVAQGREAPELSAKAQKEAELANLELAVAQVSDQASSAGATGGLLNQIRDFNAFLERTAVALESR